MRIYYKSDVDILQKNEKEWRIPAVSFLSFCGVISYAKFDKKHSNIDRKKHTKSTDFLNG